MQGDGVAGRRPTGRRGQDFARRVIVMAVGDLTRETGSLKNAGSVAR